MAYLPYRPALICLCLALLPGIILAQKKPEDFKKNYNSKYKPDILVGLTGSVAPFEKGMMPLLGATAIVNFLNHPAFGFGVSVKGWALNGSSSSFDDPYIESSANKTGMLLGSRHPLNYELADDKHHYKGATVCAMVSLQVMKSRFYLSPGIIGTMLSQYVRVNPKLVDGEVYFPEPPSLDLILVKANKQTRSLNELNLGFSVGGYYDINPVAISAGVDFLPTGIRAVSMGIMYGIPRIINNE